MVSIEIDYEQTITKIQAKLDDIFQTVVDSFINKTKLDPDKITFSSNGRIIQMNDIIENIMQRIDKESKSLKVLAISLENTNVQGNNMVYNGIQQSNEVICPMCQESCKLEIKNYRIKLYDCKNGHTIENIKFDEYINYQKIDLSKIICNKCTQVNKKDSINNEFYKCYTCNMNLCPMCRINHEDEHNVLNHDKRYYYCNLHHQKYTKYCNGCNINICSLCENEHSSHFTSSFKADLEYLKQIKNKRNQLRKEINSFNDNLKGIIKKLNKLMENMEIFYNIYDRMSKNFEKNEFKNNNTITNFEMINSFIDKELHNIREKYNYGYNINQLLYQYNEINDKNLEIQLNYNFKNISNNMNNNININMNYQPKFRILSPQFIKNNIYKCKIIFNEKEYELKEYAEDIYYQKNINQFSIKLRGINNVTDMSFLFAGCDYLCNLFGLSEWDISNVTNISYIFAGCSSLLSLPDISRWNTSNITNMSNLLHSCSSLNSLPDISKWNTSNVINMSHMFELCSALNSLPDISKWDTSNISTFSCMFNNCRSLKYIPDLLKWSTSLAANKSRMFEGCNSYIRTKFANF